MVNELHLHDFRFRIPYQCLYSDPNPNPTISFHSQWSDFSDSTAAQVRIRMSIITVHQSQCETAKAKSS